MSSGPEPTDVRGPASSAIDPAARLLQLFDRLFVGLALLIGASWLLLAVQHIDDRAFIDWGAGAKMGLAQEAANGTLYPPLFENDRYGGTRYMPIPILLHAGLSRLTHEFLSSGKLMTYLSFVGLVALGYRSMRSVGCSRPRAAVLLGAVAVSGAGLVTSLSISHDPLPVVLQLGALTLVARTPTRNTTVAAALLCAAALFAKLSALWALGAVSVWLWRRDKRLLPTFLAGFLVTSVVGVLASHFASGGRFTQNLIELWFSGVRDGGITHSLSQLATAAAFAPALLVFVPVASVETTMALRRGDQTIFHLAFVLSAAILASVWFDIGATYNQVLDLLVLSGIVTAFAWSRRENTAQRRAVIATLLTIGAITSVLSGWETVRLKAAGPEFNDSRPLEGLIEPHDRILSEDASIPIELGQRPVVLDPFMLQRVGRRHPSWLGALVDRIERADFDRIVLVHRLDRTPEGWYIWGHFGSRVADAIRRHYVLLGVKGGFAVYAPA